MCGLPKFGYAGAYILPIKSRAFVKKAGAGAKFQYLYLARSCDRCGCGTFYDGSRRQDVRFLREIFGRRGKKASRPAGLGQADCGFRESGGLLASTSGGEGCEAEADDCEGRWLGNDLTLELH